MEGGPTLLGSLHSTLKDIFVLPWLLQSAKHINTFFLTAHYCNSLSPSPSKLGRQSCRVACLLICVHVYNKRDKRGVAPADSFISPVQNVFFLTAHYFNAMVPIAQQAGQAVVPRRLSLNLCLCVQQIHPDVASSLPSMNAAPRRKFAQVGSRNLSTFIV